MCETTLFTEIGPLCESAILKKKESPLKKPLIVLIMLLSWLTVPAFAQESQIQTVAPSFWNFGVPKARTFFPHDWLRGFTEIEGSAPHNEPDLDRCAMTTPAQGPNSPCTAFARYMISGYVEIQPLGRTFFRHVFVFYQPRISFGRNVPQASYTASFEPMAYDRSMGVGVELPKNFEFRYVQHRVDWLGRYAHNLGPNDLGSTGPYGLYATVGLRWYFGGYGRSHGSANF